MSPAKPHAVYWSMEPALLTLHLESSGDVVIAMGEREKLKQPENMLSA